MAWKNRLQCLLARSRCWGEGLGPLALRLLLAVEFGASGWEKLHGQNWFADIQSSFPFPFSLVPPEVSWSLATWSELLGALLLVLGLGTRFVSVSLVILTLVATYSVHWPHGWTSVSELLAQGYDICDAEGGNFKLPLFYLVMFVPLLFSGAGWCSVDHGLRRRWERGLS